MLTPEEKIHLLRALRKTGVFWSFSTEQVNQLLSAFVKLEIRKGEEILRQGENEKNFYVIGRGRVSVWAETTNERRKIATLEQGNYFGEMALIIGQPRNATIISEEHCELFVLYINEFKRILTENPIIRGLFFGIAFQKMKEINNIRTDRNNFQSILFKLKPAM